MVAQVSIQQEPAPTNKRIGRIRFLLEFLIAAFLVKVGLGALDRGLPSIWVLVPLSVSGLGYTLAIWATIRRIRDIKRSVWWVSVLLVPIPLGIVLGTLMSLSGPDIINSIYVKTVWIAYMIVYLLLLGVLLFWPSAFPKTMKRATTTVKQPSIKANDRERANIADESISDIEDRAFAQAGRRKSAARLSSTLGMKLTGWSRIMIAITVSWLLALAGIVCYEHQSSNVFCQFDGEGAVCQHIFWLWAYVAQGKFEFTLRLGRLLYTALVPVAVLWLCFGAVVWIRAGFKGKP